MIVKFGGSTLASPLKISTAAKLVKKCSSQKKLVTVVVSAMGKTTDDLLEATSALSSPNRNDQVDDVLSMGERTSVRVFHTALSTQAVKSRPFDPHDDDWPIITDDQFGNAMPLLAECRTQIRKSVLSSLEAGIVPVLPGFVGKTIDGRVTTMGRGGSDVTAFVLARCLPANEVILVTDSNGILSADPKLVKDARPVSHLSVRELVGIADSGTKFLKTKAIQYMDGSFKVRITSNSNPSLNSAGTVIEGAFPQSLTAELEDDRPAMMVTITGKSISQNPRVLQAILSKITSEKARILGFSANSDSLVMYLPEPRSKGLVEAVHDCLVKHREMAAMAVRANLSIIRIAGAGLVQRPGLIASVTDPLKANSLNVYGIFTIASSIVLIVDWLQRQKALQLVTESLRRI